MIPVLVLLVSLVVQTTWGATTVPITNHWSGGFQGEACIPITKELNGWKAHLLFSEDVDSLEVWAATATKVTPREFVLVNKDYNSVEHVGDKLCFTFLGHGTGDIVPTTTIYIEGMDDAGGVTSAPGVTQAPVVTSPPNTGGGTSNKDYGAALGKSILFYDAQRSGKLPANNPIPWRGDSAVNDCVPGGWYDAGDHVKFGLPMASTSTVLLWSLVRFQDGYEKAGQLDMMYDMIKWPLDYFLKAWNPQSKELVVQVGDGGADHSFWGRPEDMTMARPCQTVSSSNKGSDIAAETAAALAAGSIAFKTKGDTAYSSQLLAAAESLYAFAKANRGIFSGATQFYGSSGDKDEMCEASAWLYRATKNNQYLDDAKTFVEDAWAWALSWDDKKVACQEILYEETQNSHYKDAVVGFLEGWMPSGGITYTPCGLAWRDKWGANRYAGNTAFVALLAAEAGINTAKYRQWAVEQINYILGDNHHDGGCYSFQIGYGSKYPRQPHHRGASCPDRPAPCGQEQLSAPGPSPQTLTGALVGGPEANDNYQDVRTDYVLNEVATDYNSGFHGALAGIVHLQATNNFPATNNKCPCAGK
ncbi:endoglucanase E-4-like [Physella acuta]|uniref:endoglucanase E-4-like n=1 Tax=Physella acuta TaxID=109671 RepID=UPI0027DBB56F|nr:endoglucanase E-4-like [Physella acuta]XP_059173972.1 endoglucanase E-4-like [Physella acuta]XP_059173973.1 endoglucanase E-4-like [Physella acuta]